MAEKPILFNIEMVKAILEGRKTQTRRILKNDKIQARPTATAITIDAPYRTFLWHPMYCYKPETVRGAVSIRRCAVGTGGFLPNTVQKT